MFLYDRERERELHVYGSEIREHMDLDTCTSNN